MLDKFDFNGFRKDVEDALTEVAKKYDVNIKAAGIRYDAVSFDMTLKVAERVEGDEDGGQAKWNYYCYRYGLEPGDYGKEVVVDGERLKITGLQPSRQKYPIVVKRIRDNREMVYTLSSIKEALEK